MNELNSRMKRTGERFCEPEDRTREITNMSDREKLKRKREEKRKDRASYIDLYICNKRSACVLREPEWEEKKCEAEKLFKKQLK